MLVEKTIICTIISKISSVGSSSVISEIRKVILRDKEIKHNALTKRCRCKRCRHSYRLLVRRVEAVSRTHVMRGAPLFVRIGTRLVW